MRTLNDVNTNGPHEQQAVSDPADAATIVGNVYNKYHSRNPLARWMMGRFLKSVSDLYQSQNPQSVLEVGCGEGYLSQHLLQSCSRPDRFEACDISLAQLASNCDPLITFREASVYQLPYEDGEFDLVVCCDVLEHLEDPLTGISELARVSKRAVLLSTPREPLWRILNMARGYYWRSFGNTPGHVQHFSRRGLINLAKTQLRVAAQRTPCPWTVLLCETEN